MVKTLSTSAHERHRPERVSSNAVSRLKTALIPAMT